MVDAPEIHKGEPAARYTDSIRKYIVIFLCILLLAALQFVIAYTHVDTEHKFARMLFIALAEAGLALLFFMHLWEHRGANRLVFVAALLFIALLIGGILADVVTRYPPSLPPR